MCKNNYIQKNKGMLLSRHRTTKERKRNGVLRKQVTGEIPQRHILDRRQHGVAGDRGVVFHCICGSCRFADGKLAWLLRSCRGRSDDTAEAAWPGVFLCAECVDFGSRCAAARRAEAGCGE